MMFLYHAKKLLLPLKSLTTDRLMYNNISYLYIVCVCLTSQPCSILDITTVSPPGLMRSPLTTLNSRESYINVTWTPSPSQHGANIFCYTASDILGCVETMLVNAVCDYNGHPSPTMTWCWNHVLFALFMVVSSFILLIRLTSPMRCITLVVGGTHQTNTAMSSLVLYMWKAV